MNVRLAIVLAVAVTATACRGAEPPKTCPPPQEREQGTAAQDFREFRQPKAADLGPPLVDNAEQLERLDPALPIWLDRQNRRVVLVGYVCKTVGPLEFFACLARSKEYESVVAVHPSARAIQAALLAAGAEQGCPVQFAPEFRPPTGTQVDVSMVWKGNDGQRQTARAQDWIRREGTLEAMAHNWVFVGSRFVRDEQTGEELFEADLTGDLISVANFPSAVLDVAAESTASDPDRLFEAFEERIPPRGTPVTLLLKPK